MGAPKKRHTTDAQVGTSSKAEQRERVRAEFWRVVVGDPPGNRDLWERVTYWRDRLRDCDDYPFLSGLESSWQLLDAYYEGAIKRDDDQRTGDTPLTAFFFCIEMGFYPPPELVLALGDAFEVYKVSEGQISLEEAFFGPPRKKAGSYAKRKATRFQRMSWGLHLDGLMRKGNTKARAAELVSEEEKRVRVNALIKSGYTKARAEEALNGQFEPETIARRALMPRFSKRPRVKK